ncbi:TPA: hypothetical protein QCQ70_003290 [Bacillus cytotoxicus]|uniref:hypothetical protein n=1 Tax=Bacillus paranthracis TaxID=2026186 RepID=UPI0032F78ADC|nr:hypothetical protein [Bacillus cytotoxicus]
MLLKALVILFKEWKMWIFFLIPFVLVFFLDLGNAYNDKSYNDYKDLTNLLSWLFTGIMSLVSFSALFIAFTFENKLVTASKSLKRILKPYSLNKGDLRNTLINYENDLSKDHFLSVLYYVYLIITFFSILVWGTTLKFYRGFNYSEGFKLSIGNFLKIGSGAFFVIVCLSLMLISIALKLIRMNKDPLGKGYLPQIDKICDVDYLVENKADIMEFFSLNFPILEVYKNPASSIVEHEVTFTLPITISNFRFVIKLYQSKDRKGILTCFGNLANQMDKIEVGESYTCIVTNKLKEEIYHTINEKDCYGILKIYDKEKNVVAKYTLKKRVETEFNFHFEMDKKLLANFDGSKDRDYGLIESIQCHNGKLVDYQLEM